MEALAADLRAGEQQHNPSKNSFIPRERARHEPERRSQASAPFTTRIYHRPRKPLASLQQKQAELKTHKIKSYNMLKGLGMAPKAP